MKTKLSVHIGTLWVMAIITAFTLGASAYGKEAAKGKSYTGTITAVDTKDNTVRVRGYLFSKSFILADDCALALGDKTSAALADFRPGQRVDIRYRDASGVLVAERITQELMHFTGTVRAIDVSNHTLTVHRRGMNRTFTLADNCRVQGNGKSNEALNHVKWGDRVTVVYETPGDQTLAREIELPGLVFTGSLDAIDLGERSISAGKRFLNDKKFRLADDCVIIANGKTDARLSDLRLGRTYELNYESVDGVNVVNRIASVEPTAKNEEPASTAQAAPPEQ